MLTNKDNGFPEKNLFLISISLGFLGRPTDTDSMGQRVLKGERLKFNYKKLSTKSKGKNK